jgi:hypothetical protein
VSKYLYEEELIRRYQTEVFGEAYFNQMLSQFDAPEHKFKAAVMLQLETETKARVRAMMLSLGMDVKESQDSREIGTNMAEEMRGKPWLDAISEFRELAIKLLDEEKEIAAKAPSEYQAYAQSMVAHGQCFFDFSELELNGESDVSLRPIIELLEHKVPLLPPG